ncbi:hypothetical protein VPH35_099958 [Triticum aestivum]
MAVTVPSAARHLLLLVTVTVVSVAAATPSSPGRPFRTLYAFGDSLTDTGNTHSTTGPYSFGVSHPPYGATFFHRPTNRYSDGRLVVEFLATDVLALPSLLLELTTMSSPSPVWTGAICRKVLDVRTGLYQHFLPPYLSTLSRGVGDALFWAGEIGANDYGYSFMAPDALPSERIRNMAIDRITTFLHGLLKRGAKYVVVQGMPLTGCLPLAMTLSQPWDRENLSCVASINRQNLDHNHHLQAGLHRLRRSHPDAIIAYADYHAAHLAVVRSPARYGFTEPFKACCGTGGGAYRRRDGPAAAG